LRTVHGGAHAVGRRKSVRPFSSKRPIHLTMRSSWAQGHYSLRRAENQEFIRAAVTRLAAKWGVKVYKLSINSNHLHFVVRGKTRCGFQNFLRVLAGQIACFVTKAKKGIALKKRFWDLPAFTRLAEWGKAFHVAKRYVFRNCLEAAGLIAYTPRKPATTRPAPWSKDVR